MSLHVYDRWLKNKSDWKVNWKGKLLIEKVITFRWKTNIQNINCNYFHKTRNMHLQKYIEFVMTFLLMRVISAPLVSPKKNCKNYGFQTGFPNTFHHFPLVGKQIVLPQTLLVESVLLHQASQTNRVTLWNQWYSSVKSTTKCLTAVAANEVENNYKLQLYVIFRHIIKDLSLYL